MKSILLTLITGSVLLSLSFQNTPGTISKVTAAPEKPKQGSTAPLSEDGVNLEAFHLVSTSEGWLLLDQHLYWTQDGGQRWTDITPSNPDQMDIQAVWFIDAASGWLVLTGLEASEGPAYTFARTADGGRSWQVVPLSLFAPGTPGPPTGAVYLYFLDAKNGWLVLKQATSSNFSQGALFRTRDGGLTWQELTIPIGEPVYFVTPQRGWTAGGPAGDQFYQTTNGGLTWQVQQPGAAGVKPNQPLFYRLPTFEDTQHGVLPVLVGDEIRPRVEFYESNNSGTTWELAKTAPLGQNVTAGTVVPIEVLTRQRWLIILPGSDRLLHLSSSLAAASVSHNEWIRGIVALNMVTPETGWARYSSGVCLTQPGATIRCTRETGLLQTQDGGQSWSPLDLPGVDVSKINRGIIRESFSVPAGTQNAGPVSGQAFGEQTGIFTGHGFDKCEVASASQLQNWMISGPYRVVNLYIGGSSRGCRNSVLSASMISQLSSQGWQFIPTWVGPQAACTTYISRMSSNLNTAYNQGMSEADAALEIAANLGLTLEDHSGTVIYYDLEYYDYTDAICHNAAKAFIAGWTAQLRGKGNHAGVYSTGSILNGFAGIPNVPDVIWPAHWLTPYYYNPNTSVWNVYSLSNSLWNQQQRIRQYSGGHNETWGGLTMNIDSNVLEGVVASLWREKVYLPLIEPE